MHIEKVLRFVKTRTGNIFGHPLVSLVANLMHLLKVGEVHWVILLKLLSYSLTEGATSLLSDFYTLWSTLGDDFEQLNEIIKILI